MNNEDRLIKLLEEVIASGKLTGRDAYGLEILDCMKASLREQTLTRQALEAINTSGALNKTAWMWSNEVRDYLQISVSTLYRAQKENFAQTRRVGRTRQFLRADVEKHRDRYLK